jgi:hypothetical protein
VLDISFLIILPAFLLFVLLFLLLFPFFYPLCFKYCMIWFCLFSISSIFVFF